MIDLSKSLMKNSGAPLTDEDMDQYRFQNESEILNDLAWTSIEPGVQEPNHPHNIRTISSWPGFFDPCFERYNETHFASESNVFVLGKYFNAEPIDTIRGGWQLFPGALKIDLKNNGSLVNSRPQEPGKDFAISSCTFGNFNGSHRICI